MLSVVVDIIGVLELCRNIVERLDRVVELQFSSGFLEFRREVEKSNEILHLLQTTLERLSIDDDPDEQRNLNPDLLEPVTSIRSLFQEVDDSLYRALNAALRRGGPTRRLSQRQVHFFGGKSRNWARDLQILNARLQAINSYDTKRSRDGRTCQVITIPLFGSPARKFDRTALAPVPVYEPEPDSRNMRDNRASAPKPRRGGLFDWEAHKKAIISAYLTSSLTIKEGVEEIRAGRGDYEVRSRHDLCPKNFRVTDEPFLAGRALTWVNMVLGHAPLALAVGGAYFLASTELQPEGKGSKGLPPLAMTGNPQHSLQPSTDMNLTLIDASPGNWRGLPMHPPLSPPLLIAAIATTSFSLTLQHYILVRQSKDRDLVVFGVVGAGVLAGLMAGLDGSTILLRVAPWCAVASFLLCALMPPAPPPPENTRTDVTGRRGGPGGLQGDTKEADVEKLEDTRDGGSTREMELMMDGLTTKMETSEACGFSV